MKERSGMPYDVVAFEADEQAMLLTAEQEGFFHRLLRRAWLHGSIPDDVSKLAVICRAVTHNQMRKAWEAIAPMWVPHPTEPNRLINKKQESEREFVRRQSEKQKGRVEKRWAKHSKNQRKRDTAVLPRNNPVIQDSGTAVIPSPSQPAPTLENSLSLSRAYGEFGCAKLTNEEYAKLKARLNGKLDTFIGAFDRWVHEAPNAKHNGVRRKDRHAYESIIAWFEKDQSTGNARASPGVKFTQESAVAPIDRPKFTPEQEKQMQREIDEYRKGTNGA